MPAITSPLSLREKLAYGLGDSAANLVFQTQISFLLFFYTDVLGISAAVAGSILVFSRGVDAVNDPIVGALADRTRTRWGRYRPWILVTAVPLALALVLCFTAPQLAPRGRIIWALVTYNLMMIIYAANNIPYCALSGVMTSDSHERTSLASWRFACAMTATLVVNMFTDRLVRLFGQGDQEFGFQCTMGLWGAMAVCLLVATFAFTKERVDVSPRRRSTLWQDLGDLARNGPWIALFSIAVLIYIQLALRSSMLLYYFSYYSNAAPVFQGVTNYGLFNGVGLAVAMIGLFLARPLAERFGKRRVFCICLLLAALLMAALALAPRSGLGLLFALQVAMQLAFGPTIPLLWAMMADVADYGQWKTGRRSTALAFASIVFGTKLGLGAGVWLSGGVLDYVGYTAGEVQSAVAMRGIVLLVSVIPACFLVLAACLLLCYRIDDRLAQEIERSLAMESNDGS